MTTMRDVAARAGVSTKTVSRVFNDDPHVLPPTRQAVEAAMRELNYVPNVLATTFRAGRASVIGVAVPDIVDPFFSAIARGVEDAARERGMSTMVTSVGEDPAGERAALESMLGRQLSGLVVAPVGLEHSWLERWREHTPIVFVDRAPVGLEADAFTEQDEQGAQLAVSHLQDHGHRRIAYMGDAIHLSTEAHRVLGWRAALAERGVQPADDLIFSGIADYESARRAVARLRASAEAPTAIFAANARTTMALVRVLRDAPMPLVGFGDFPMADAVRPSVTVIDQDPRSLGMLAAERVFARLDGAAVGSMSTVLGVRLIERESCAVGAASV